MADASGIRAVDDDYTMWVWRRLWQDTLTAAGFTPSRAEVWIDRHLSVLKSRAGSEMAETASFDEPRLFRDWFVRVFRVWPRCYWGHSLNATLSVYDRLFMVTGFYGISVGPTFLGFMKLRLNG